MGKIVFEEVNKAKERFLHGQGPEFSWVKNLFSGPEIKQCPLVTYFG